ncbi:MAG: TonB-dependent receptor [Sphingobium sp.]|uniref:TonB-dependent receptor n=1 Tax=Sphingobium sp. TaxID=1912891 RepID=UPI000DB3F6B5|nr:TonB-dependent receptor [Sphingobium sp.]PZU14823.1 MAG: TonB-dependent receptor [Sphingobium sp.]
MKTIEKAWLFTTIFMPPAIWAGPIMAQTGGGAVAVAAPSPTDSTDIIVTARRREESIQSVPVSVSALNAEGLRQRSVTQLNDIRFSVPGVFLLGAGSVENSTYTIRAQSRPTSGTGQPGVVTYFAEVPLPTTLSSAPTYDLANIQVLKGPQGTLFGRNTIGGAVLITPARAEYEFGGYAQATYGNYDAISVEGAVNIPIVADRVALRLATRIDRRDGYTKNLGTGGDLDDLHSDSLRATLRLDPTDWLSNDFIVDYRKQDQNSAASVAFGVLPIAVTQGVAGRVTPPVQAQLARGPRVVDYGAFKPISNVRTLGLFNRTTITMSDSATLINIFGFRKQSWYAELNTDGLPDFVGILDAHNVFHEQQLSNEVQLRLSPRPWADVTLGGFYLDNRPNGVNGSDLDLFYGSTNGRFKYQYYYQKSKALFGNASINLGSLAEGLKLNAGFRYTWDNFRTCIGAGEFQAPYRIKPKDCSVTNPNFAPFSGAEIATSSSAPTWTIGLDYQMRPDLFVYAVTRRGYRAGGLNQPRLGGSLAAVQSFKPETLTDVELGAKSSFRVAGMRTKLNVSVFRGKSKDVQFIVSGFSTNLALCNPANPTRPSSPDGDCDPNNDPASSAVLTNVGDKVVKGLEFEASIEPVAGLTIGGTGSILNQKTTRLDAPAAVASNISSSTEIPFTLQAKHSYTVNGRYVVPGDVFGGNLAFGVDYFWSGKVLLNTYLAPSYGLVNARIDLNNVGGRGVDLSLFMRNVFDKTALVTGSLIAPTLPVLSGIYTEPRMYGVQLRYRFGE